MRSWIRKTRGWKLPLIGAAGFALALYAVLGRGQEEAKTPPVAPPAASFADSVAGIGVVEPKSETIAVSPELPGIIREVAVAAEQRVAQGDLLFALDQRDIDAQIAVLEAQLASARVQAADAAAQFAIVRNVGDQRAVAKDDYNRRKYGSELARSRVREIEAQLEQARTTKERLTVLAPIDGTVLDVNARPGEFAPATPLNEPLIRMGDLSSLHVRVEFDEEYAASFNPNATVQAFRRGDSSQPIALRFVRVEPLVRPKENLIAGGQRVDTRVLQIIYALPPDTPNVFVGQQLDVFVEEAAHATP